MTRDTKITLRTEDYKIFFSAVGITVVLNEIISCEDIASSELKISATRLLQKLRKAMDDSVFGQFPEMDKDKEEPTIEKACEDIIFEVAKRAVVTRVTVDAEE